MSSNIIRIGNKRFETKFNKKEFSFNNRDANGRVVLDPCQTQFIGEGLSKSLFTAAELQHDFGISKQLCHKYKMLYACGRESQPSGRPSFAAVSSL
jgi:hypothetical protein